MPYARATSLLLLLVLAACAGTPGTSGQKLNFVDDSPLYPNETPQLRQMIEKASATYDVPVDLVQKVVVRESTHNPEARNGPYYGLMQISAPTARAMGFDGKPRDLLNARTNLTYAVKYLRGAWLLADGSYERAVKWYSQGYYYEAKRRGMLEETGLR
ncbi:lytic transglycosylase domain-containing protein [Pseudooceanicola sp. CBS1P-1]|uniref:Transglycosylase SLT domain-containing protein n=1 Tax=Pseudooceanicola albus TaxID=2692189 RepID=A0A6L7G468_9RHOB|nr:MULTISPECIES: lytic transglycosylase domain-containing protein [Pseudooceanicola]MBT9384846.1 lytic transglycosylase domain-containing protein [Pseudooceanicola endophyticus]MXN18160.1 transglycosylase SLT domain-containing protein [Pseudooceanicola albus]